MRQGNIMEKRKTYTSNSRLRKAKYSLSGSKATASLPGKIWSTAAADDEKLALPC